MRLECVIPAGVGVNFPTFTSVGWAEFQGHAAQPYDIDSVTFVFIKVLFHMPLRLCRNSKSCLSIFEIKRHSFL